MSLRLTLIDTDREIERKINASIAEEMNARVKKNTVRVKKQILQAIPDWIRHQPEIQSLDKEGTPGSLNAQFGLLPGQGDLATSQIINAVMSSLEVRVKQIDKNLRGGIEFSIQPEDMRNLLGLPSGTTITGDTILPWLEWLLIAGTQTIVFGFNYSPDFSGRSGGGTMEAGGVWRIPPEYAGALRDNFITRALFARDRELKTILQGIFND